MNAASRTPTISIVIAAYQAGDQLTACLDSIRALAIDDLEVVVVDGASDDHTVQLLKGEIALPLSWISEPDKGIYDALNKGVKMARGRWIHFLGTDDRLLPGFAELVSLLKEEDTIYYANSVPVYREGPRPSYELLGGPFSKYRLAKYCVNHQAVFYPASVFRRYQYDLQYRIFADYALNMQLWGNGQYRRSWHAIDIVQYNMTGFSSRERDIMFVRHKPGLIRQHLGWWVYWRFSWKKFRKHWYGEKEWW